MACVSSPCARSSRVWGSEFKKTCIDRFKPQRLVHPGGAAPFRGCITRIFSMVSALRLRACPPRVPSLPLMAMLQSNERGKGVMLSTSRSTARRHGVLSQAPRRRTLPRLDGISTKEGCLKTRELPPHTQFRPPPTYLVHTASFGDLVGAARSS